MSTIQWDPGQYAKFADARGRPFHELVGRVPVEAPRYVVDLGCGPGDLTATLAERWPEAYVEGIDSSPQMIERATAYTRPGRLEFRVDEVTVWRPARDVDVLLSNATLQWVPDHLSELPRLIQQVAADGWIAIQVPGNFDAPSHQLLRELRESPRWARAFAGVGELFRPMVRPADYLDALHDAGCDRLDVWETTYDTVLAGPDPVFEWMKGTGARPYLQALAASANAEPGDEQRFAEEYRAALAEAYPARPYGTVMPFRRVFAVAHRP